MQAMQLVRPYGGAMQHASSIECLVWGKDRYTYRTLQNEYHQRTAAQASPPWGDALALPVCACDSPSPKCDLRQTILIVSRGQQS